MTKDNNLLGNFDLRGIAPAPRGVPQIEVSFDIDANGILNVSACDKSTGRSEKITISNEKGRLSKEEIDRMLKDAEKFAGEDAKQRERVAAKNQLEQLVYSYKQSAQDAPGDKLSSGDKQIVEDKCKEIITWLDNNNLAEKDEIEYKMQELQKVCSPIMTKLHGGAQGGAQGGAFPGGAGPAGSGQSGPTVEEVD